MIYVHPLSEMEKEELEKLTQRAIGRVSERAWFILLSYNGKSIREICSIFGRSPACVRKWIKRYESEGVDGMYDRPRVGRGEKIKADIKYQIDKDMQKSPSEFGFLAGFWTLPLLACYLLSQFSILVSFGTLRKIVRQLGYRCRRPRLAASKIDAFAKEKLAAIAEVSSKKKEYSVILYQDETTFRLLPLLRRMWMKVAKQMRIITPKNWNRHFSVFGALNSQTGEFLSDIFDAANSVSFIAFLEQLIKNYQGKIIFLILDNASYHRSKMVQTWLLKNPQIQFLWLPKNNPQLNPVEKIWWRLKDIVAANRGYESLTLLRENCIKALSELTPETVIQLTKLAA